MKHLRRICGGFLLVIALSIPAFAGETLTPPGETSTPPGETQTPPGETNAPPGITGDILGPGFDLIISILF